MVSSCVRPSASVAHSLQGRVSTDFSQDAMIQGLVSNDQKVAIQRIISETKEYFIVDARTNVLCIDADKLCLRIIDDNDSACEIVSPERLSKTIGETLSNAY